MKTNTDKLYLALYLFIFDEECDTYKDTGPIFSYKLRCIVDF